MVLYNYDSNAILAEGCKYRTATELTALYDKLYNGLTKVRIVSVMQQIDNEVLINFDQINQGKRLTISTSQPT